MFTVIFVHQLDANVHPTSWQTNMKCSFWTKAVEAPTHYYDEFWETDTKDKTSLSNDVNVGEQNKVKLITELSLNKVNLVINEFIEGPNLMKVYLRKIKWSNPK